MTDEDVIRELEKCELVLGQCEQYLQAYHESMQHIHLAPKMMGSPLYSAVCSARMNAQSAIERLKAGA